MGPFRFYRHELEKNMTVQWVLHKECESRLTSKHTIAQTTDKVFQLTNTRVGFTLDDGEIMIPTENWECHGRENGETRVPTFL